MELVKQSNNNLHVTVEFIYKVIAKMVAITGAVNFTKINL